MMPILPTFISTFAGVFGTLMLCMAARLAFWLPCLQLSVKDRETAIFQLLIVRVIGVGAIFAPTIIAWVYYS